MSDNQTYYDSASLAEAAYIYFDNLDEVNWGIEEELRDFLEESEDSESKFSKIQAAEFAKTWEVVSHRPNTPSGFSATLFKRRNPEPGQQKYYYAFRGTEGPKSNDLWKADIGNIVHDGLAFKQIIDL